jgi:hypothetical protein
MAIFWRIYNNNLTPVFETDLLGFSIDDPSYIPDEYLNSKKFIIYRTCHSIGDWAIISAFPRLLKLKYPDCKVFVPSSKLIENMFRGFNNWNHWKNPFESANLVFKNNPYIDSFIDNIEDEVFHDHYRIYNPENFQEPLVKQMLKFWQFKEDEISDYLPELYFSQEEIIEGNSIIEKYLKDKKFGTLLLTNTVKEFYPEEVNKILLEEVNSFSDLTYFYYGSKPIKETIFKHINYIDFKDLNLPIRIQLYIKTKALVNIGYQSGVNDAVCRYSKVICTPSTGNLGSDYLDSITYKNYSLL